jgi:hypothetical protein
MTSFTANATRAHRAQIVAEAVVSAYINEITAAEPQETSQLSSHAVARPAAAAARSEFRHPHPVVVADLAHYPRRHARREHSGRQIAGYDCSRSDYRVAADRHA